MTHPNNEVVIIGGGIAGLSCARRLNFEGIAFTVLEASDRIGGRVKTDRHKGYLLDRGFQVLLTAYPEAKRVLDYPKLDLHMFAPGAVIRTRTVFYGCGSIAAAEVFVRHHESAHRDVQRSPATGAVGPPREFSRS